MSTEPDPGIPWEDMPSPDEILAARRTIKRMHRLIYPARKDSDYREVWNGLVEAGRMVAVATSWLGIFREEYAALWQQMMAEDG